MEGPSTIFYNCAGFLHPPSAALQPFSGWPADRPVTLDAGTCVPLANEARFRAAVETRYFVREGLQFSPSAEMGLNLTCAKSVFCLDGSAVWEKSLGGRGTVVELAVPTQKQ